MPRLPARQSAFSQILNYLCTNMFLLTFFYFCALVLGREDDAMPAHPLIKSEATTCIPIIVQFQNDELLHDACIGEEE